MSTDQTRPEQPDTAPDAAPDIAPDPIHDTIHDTVELSTTTAASEPTIELDTTQYPTTQSPTTEFPTTQSPTTQYSTTEFPTTEYSTAPAAEVRPDDQTALPVAPPRVTPRVGTVVWGLVLAVIGAGVIAAAAGFEFDVELASIALLALAGIGLVVGSIATSARRRHR
jgi:hypothetical protein